MRIDGNLEEEVFILTLFENVSITGQKARIKNSSKKEMIKEFNLKHGLLVGLGGPYISDLHQELLKVSQKQSESIGRKIQVSFRNVPKQKRHQLDLDVKNLENHLDSQMNQNGQNNLKVQNIGKTPSFGGINYLSPYNLNLPLIFQKEKSAENEGTPQNPESIAKKPVQDFNTRFLSFGEFDLHNQNKFNMIN